MKTLMVIWALAIVGMLGMLYSWETRLQAREAEGRAEMTQTMPRTTLKVVTSPEQDTFNPQETVNGTEMQGGETYTDKTYNPQVQDKS